MKKVYCKNCKHYYIGKPVYLIESNYVSYYGDSCNSPYNLFIIDTYKEQIKNQNKPPFILNKKNNCKLFDEAK